MVKPRGILCFDDLNTSCLQVQLTQSKFWNVKNLCTDEAMSHMAYVLFRSGNWSSVYTN